MANSNARETKKSLMSDEGMLAYAQAFYTKNATKKIKEELKDIKRIEDKYNAVYDEWKKSKPTGFNPIARYKYIEQEDKLQQWKTNIDTKKAAVQAKSDDLQRQLATPQAAKELHKLLESLRGKNDVIRQQYTGYLAYSHQLNNQIALCYSIRNKLRSHIYEGQKVLTLPDKIYQSVKTGNIVQAQNIINELRSAVNKLEGNRAQGSMSGHFLSRNYKEGKDDELER